MSFSEQVKEEILNNIDNTNEKVNKIERFGERLTSTSKKNNLTDEYGEFFEIVNLDETDIKNILKGVFLASGCVVDPMRDYHLEINFKNKACTDYIYDILSLLEFTPKIVKRKNTKSYVIYIKESDQIVTFLSLLEANKAVLDFEQVRVEKQVKNNINRNINCETANLAKTIKSSVRQIEAITKLKESGMFNNLDEKLKYAASLREKYPDKSLTYIIENKDKSIKLSKSGLKHRLDKLIEIAENK